jgi:hypothetical protein
MFLKYKTPQVAGLLWFSEIACNLSEIGAIVNGLFDDGS